MVITGVGCLSPNGPDKAAFFDALLAGQSGIKAIQTFDPAALSCRIAGEITNFDALHWISRKDAPHVSRSVPLALAAATEALSDAGLMGDDPLPLEERRRFGVILGSGGGGIELTERQYAQFFNPQSDKSPSVYAVPSGTMGTLASELSMRFGLHGASHVVSTGCTSSTDAMGYAYHHIQAGRLQRALCGGVDAPITPGIMAGFCLMRVVATGWNDLPDSGSRPFSRDRNGFVLGEGAWLFVLEERESALTRGARIYAEIKGYGATCDAYHRVRLEESGEEPARAMTLAMTEAGIAPEAVDYINLHGTGTVLNDRIETRAVRLAFGPSVARVATSSTKSMIGHPQGASGAAGVAAILCAFQRDSLPPTINLTHPDPECDLDYIPLTARSRSIEWALSNCIGFGSKNSALVLQNIQG